MKCQKCNYRKATVKWVGEGSVLDFVHGAYQNWCEICCLEAQIEHAQKPHVSLRELKEKLKKLKSSS